jgi:hypothetical protein
MDGSILMRRRRRRRKSCELTGLDSLNTLAGVGLCSFVDI